MSIFNRRRGSGTATAERPIDNLARIAELTEANRRSADPVRERELVKLRHQAFAELPVGAAAPLPDPDNAAIEWIDGLPTASSGNLTAETLKAGIDEGGCLLVRDQVGPARVAELVEGIERAFTARDQAAEDREPGWFEPLALGGGAYNLARQRQWVTSAGGVWTADSPRMTFELIDLFGDVGLLDMIGAYLGERPAASVNKWTLRRVSPGGAADWHQDGAFLGDEIRAVNVWLALTDCGRDAPGMDVIPQRLDRIVETGTEGARFDWSVSPRKVDELLGGEPPLRPEFRAGDILLFDGFFLHQTANEDEMTKDRYAVETWCFGPSYFPDKQVPLVL
jgi:hypothetical protein